MFKSRLEHLKTEIHWIDEHARSVKDHIENRKHRLYESEMRNLLDAIEAAQTDIEILSKKPRYLSYSIDKHQETPSFWNEIPFVLMQNCKDGLDIIVDLHTGQRCWFGNWTDIEVRG